MKTKYMTELPTEDKKRKNGLSNKWFWDNYLYGEIKWIPTLHHTKSVAGQLKKTPFERPNLKKKIVRENIFYDLRLGKTF